MRVSSLVDRHTSRRGFLRSLVMSATAIAFAPAYLVRPIAAEAAIITCLGLRCSSWSPCCDGWTEFCCRLTGENTCPPGTVVGGWWKVDNSSFCSYDKPRPRYYIDCNVACATTHRCGGRGLCPPSATAARCRCPDGCETRKVDCVHFRYGQCNQDTCVGPIRCRVVTCVPPWEWDPACSRRPVLTSEATRHHDRACLHDWFNDVPPNAFYAGAVRWMSDRGIAAGLTDDLFGPDEPIRWEHFATWLWNYAAGPTTGPPSPLDEANPRTDYQKALDWMAQHGIAPARTVRYPDPAGHITRAEAVTFLHRLAAVSQVVPGEESTRNDLYPERELNPARPPFPDVADGAWFAESLDWAVDHEIVWWSPPGPFHPDRFVTRSEAAVYLHRLHESRTPDPEAGSGDASEGRFSDIEGNAHEANIEIVAELGITRGCGDPEDNTYCPNRLVARSHMMVFLARALGEDDGAGVTTSRFSDVPDDAWYLPSLERMADLGVVEPFEDGSFRSGEPVTRLDMAVFMTRAFPHIDKVEDPVGVFADVPAENVHAGEVEGIHTAGVTRGCRRDPLRYCPDQPVRRDEMASFLVRALRPRNAGS